MAGTLLERRTAVKTCALFVAALLLVAGGTAHALEVGEPAPDFEAESTQGKIRLSEYQGKRNVLLAFYFKDFTGG